MNNRTTVQCATVAAIWLLATLGHAQSAASDVSVSLLPQSEVVETAVCPPPDGTRPDAALINTDTFVLERFPLRRVLEQLIRKSGGCSQTATELFQQLWDTLGPASGGKFNGPHCDDATPSSLNGHALECPRAEFTLRDAPPERFVPVALVNRFELAPADGSNCGEYRIVYAMHPFEEEDRNFIILEGVLPNPSLKQGLEGCRPVVNFWESLNFYDVKRPAGQQRLARELERFYFTGVGAFPPVIQPQNFGVDPATREASGRLRSNLFGVAPTWQLREHVLAKQCTGTNCRLYFEPTPVADNPKPELFDASNPAPEAAEFQAEFVTQLQSLLQDDVNLVSLKVTERFYASQSTSTIPVEGGLYDDYLVQAINGVNNGAFGFYFSIADELARLGRTDVSPFDVIVRANTQSCAGCHNLSKFAFLSFDGSGGPMWPDLRPGGFVHIDEERQLSPALWCEFLPYRRRVLDAFYSSESKCRGRKCFTYYAKLPPYGANTPGKWTVGGRRPGQH